MLSLREVNRIDRAGLWRVYQQWPDAARRAMDQRLAIPKGPSQQLIVLAGMGGSGTACDIVSDWLTQMSDVPTIVVKDYFLPRFVGKGITVIAVSLSGDTKETLSMFEEAVGRGCSVAAVSSGGILQERCMKMGIPHNRVERMMVPRASLPGMIFTTLRILDELGVAKVDDELREATEAMAERSRQVRPSTPLSVNPAKKMASMLKGRRTTIYAPARYASIGHHFAASMNENAKVPVSVGFYPEIFHNEIETWKTAAGRAVVLLKAKGEDREVEKRLARARSLFARARIPFTEVAQRGGSLSAILDWCMLLDMVSIYTAVLLKVSPVETPLLDKTRSL